MNPSHELRDQLLEIGFGRYEGYFASGQKANNKLELGYETVSQHPEVLGRVVARLCEIIEPYDPEFVIGVPNGAVGFATLVAQELDLYEPCLKKDAHRDFDYATDIDRLSVQCLERGALIEDVFQAGTSTLKALRVEGLERKIEVIAPVFDRGKARWRRHNPIDKPIHSIASQPIRPSLWRHSRLWRYAS